jgi:hypothetical protein
MALQKLLDATSESSAYRAAMVSLGGLLAQELVGALGDARHVLLVCTVEDADFLARGLITQLEASCAAELHLTCFWNERVKMGGMELAPIVSRYDEPRLWEQIDAVIVVKSIISGACVVRTNLMEVIHKVPAHAALLVAAPVILSGAQERLRAEFSPHTHARFQFFFLAEDSEKDSAGNVLPGIGGEVYGLLGLGDGHSKNRYRPKILAERRAAR